MKLLILCFFFATALIANNLKAINSFQASFKQTIINNSNKEILYTGKIYMKKPFNVVWRYDEPIQKFVYIQYNKVTIIEPDLEQAIISQLDKEFNLLELLNNSTQISPTQYISTFNNINYKLTIIDNQLQEISYKDSIDNTIIIHFFNINQNEPILDTIFSYSIPTDYDIIRK